MIFLWIQMAFDLLLSMDRRPDEPAYLALARALTEEVRRGRLRPGARLPGTRTLARQLGVGRNTILAAYDELAAQGWLSTREASGTFVADSVPSRRGPAGGPDPGPGLRPRPGFAVPRSPTGARRDEEPFEDESGLVRLSDGSPDNRLVPADLLARAYRRVLRRRGAALLGYGDPRGEPSLRAELARMLAATRGLAATADNILVTRGAQMALALAAAVLVRPGDRVAIERFGYRPVWDALRNAGAELVPVPVDEGGLRVDRLAQAGPLRAVYVTPHHQYPTMALLAPDRRAELLRWARAERAVVLEDDYDHEFHYRGQPVPPLMSRDGGRSVVYFGGLSKVLAPGLRVGYLVAPAPLVERAARLRRAWDRQGDLPTEAAVADLLAAGEIPRHVRRMRRIYAARRDALCAAIEDALPGVLDFRMPAGGMALWVRVRDGTDPEAWSAEARRDGVELLPAREFDFLRRSAPYLRLGFAPYDERELAQAVRRIAKARRRSVS